MSVKSYLKTNNKYESKQYNTIENLSYQKRTSSYSYTMNYDDILEELGELGPWQILNLLLLWLPSVAGGMWVLTYSFAGNTVFQMSENVQFEEDTLFTSKVKMSK